jgi:hypothetical protein
VVVVGLEESIGSKNSFNTKRERDGILAKFIIDTEKK